MKLKKESTWFKNPINFKKAYSIILKFCRFSYCEVKTHIWEQKIWIINGFISATRGSVLTCKNIMYLKSKITFFFFPPIRITIIKFYFMISRCEVTAQFPLAIYPSKHMSVRNGNRKRWNFWYIGLICQNSSDL